MNIDFSNSMNFNAQIYVKKFYVPGKENTTLRCILKQNKNKTIGFQYDVLHKGKVIESQTYSNKKGFDDNYMAHIIDVIDGKVREGVNFFLELLNALADREI